MYRQLEKKLVKQQYLFHMFWQYGELGALTAETGWRVWGAAANFNVLASLLQRRLSTEVNQTLHDVWPSAGLVYYIYTFGGSCPLTEFCQVQNSFCVQVLRSPVLAALLHCTEAKTLRHGTRNGIMELSLLIIFNRGRHLYSEGGRPSRWEWAHILVITWLVLLMCSLFCAILSDFRSYINSVWLSLFLCSMGLVAWFK